jgi:hypothetical protein
MDIVRTMEIEKANGSSKRKIKDLMQDEESVVVSSNELEELEEFLM